MDTRPHILLITTDEMRGDCLGFAGHPDVQTPYLDSLAAGGIYFPHAYSACPSCIPARAVLNTGLSQRHTGRIGYQDGVEWNYRHTIAGELSAAGYQTHCAGKMHVWPLRNNLGYHSVDLHDGYLHHSRFPDQGYYENQLVADDYLYWLKTELGADADITDTGLECNSWITRPWPYAEKYHPTNWVVSRCLDFLRRRDPRRPFFLTASFVRPHAPLDAPQCYFDLYEGRQLRPPFSGDWDRRDWLAEDSGNLNSPVGPANPELIRRQQVGYYACITHIDHQIGRLIMALVERRLIENTVIIFASDHGEMLSDHCLCRKALPCQGSIHIPLFISAPESLLGRSHGRDESLVELRDIMPTTLDLARAPIPPSLDGQSLLKSPSREYLHGEHTYWFRDRSSQFIITQKDKFIWFSQTGEEQYFNLDSDPTESHNAITDPEYGERIAYLRSILIRELDGCEEGYSAGGALIPGKKPLLILSNAVLPN